MIISENEIQFLIDLKDFQKLTKKLGILELKNDQIKRWIDYKKIDGIYEKGGICGVYVDKGIYNVFVNSAFDCNKCIYKDRLSIISGILSKGVQKC